MFKRMLKILPNRAEHEVVNETTLRLKKWEFILDCLLIKRPSLFTPENNADTEFLNLAEDEMSKINPFTKVIFISTWAQVYIAEYLDHNPIKVQKSATLKNTGNVLLNRHLWREDYEVLSFLWK